jgi:hypothetical protein
LGCGAGSSGSSRNYLLPREKLFERTVADAEAHAMVGRIARDAHNRGMATAEILAEIEQTTGPAPEHPEMNFAFHHPNATPDEFLHAALGQIAFQIGGLRRVPKPLHDDERTLEMVLSWTQTAIPKLFKH